MDIYQAFEQRKSIRDFEQVDGHPRPLDGALVEKLIAAGFTAPTNDHMRDWHFVLLNDLDARRGLISEVIHPISRKRAENVINRWGFSDTDQREMYLDAIPKQFSMLANCGCLILPFYRQEKPLLKPKDISALNYFASIWLCIGNILNAAAAEGIYGVTRIPAPEESLVVKTKLNIPHEYEFPCWLALGYPAAGAGRARQVKIDPASRIHQNHWQ